MHDPPPRSDLHQHPRQRRRLTPLTAALVIPIVFGVVLAGIWLASHTRATLPLVPRDDATAAQAARGWLLQRGLVQPRQPLVARQVSRGDLAAFATWQVTVPQLGSESDVTAMTMLAFTDSGTGITAYYPALDPGDYTLR
jgi:hypothetical protein